jgi:hypothetical protein|tara:strand:+ start:130 stop:309 length:180 start_codon:yes stop_codon:yes gene_type:complete
MDAIELANQLKRLINEQRSAIQETMMDGLLKDIEHYKNLQGQIHSLNLVEAEIANFFKE